MIKKIFISTGLIILILIIAVIGYYYFLYKEPVDDQKSEAQTGQEEALEESEPESLIGPDDIASLPANVILSASAITVTEGESIDFTWSADEATFYNFRVRPSEGDWMAWVDVPLEHSSIPFSIAGVYDVQIQACNDFGCIESNIVTIMVTSTAD